MELSNDKNLLTLFVEKVGLTNNNIRLSFSVVLNDKRTDTDIQFKNDSYISINDWQQKCITLLSENKLELENFSFHADHKVYEVEENGFENIRSFFELSSNDHNSKLKFVVESKRSFERMFADEIAKAIQSRPSFVHATPASCLTDAVTHVELKLIKAYTDGRCVLQLKVYSDNFYVVRKFDDWTDEARWIYEQIQQFNNGKKERIEIVGEFIEMEFNWVDGRKLGKGSVLDFSSPGPNELIFEDCIDIEMENVNWDNLPLIPATYIPASEFNVDCP